jgi:hypothetical protein
MEGAVSDPRKHREEECEEEECIAVKGCRKGRPVKVRLEEDCDPIPVRLEQKHCEPLHVKLKQEHCDPLQVHIKGKPHVHQAEGDCWHVQGCKDGEPVHVIVDNPAPGVQNDQFVFNGVAWEPQLTPSKFVPFNNVQVPSGAPGIAIWTPAPGMRFRIMGIVFTGSVAGRYTFKDGAGGPVLLAITLVANEPFLLPALGNGVPASAIGNPLYVEFNDSVTTITTVTGTVFGQETP